MPTEPADRLPPKPKHKPYQATKSAETTLDNEGSFREATSKKIIGNLGKMVQAVKDQGKKAILFNVPNANEAMFPPYVARELREKRDFHNAQQKEFCGKQGVPLADIFTRLKDEHFADELHPNEAGAKIIAETVFAVLSTILNPRSIQ